MFELGSSLREARVRRGLELAQVAVDTRIRTRYLQALEEERFELLPGSVYAKGFLRTYADYLRLDSQVFLDEYNARFSAEEASPAPPQLVSRPRSLRSYRVAAVTLLLALGGALLVWQLRGPSHPPVRSHPASAAAAEAPGPATPLPTTPTTRDTRRADKGASTALVLRAVGGPCWLLVREGSEQGRQLFEGTLEPGELRRFRERRLWVRIGAPWNLIASRGWRRLPLPPTVASLLVTAGGIRTISPK